MTPMTRKAMTWATLAAAIVSALLVAAIEAGWPERFGAAGNADGSVTAANSGFMGRQGAAAGTAAGRTERSRRAALQR
jgi:hypothetical protein